MPPSMNDPYLIGNNSPNLVIDHPRTAKATFILKGHRPQMLPENPILQLSEERLSNLRSAVGKQQQTQQSQLPRLLRRQASEPPASTSAQANKLAATKESSASSTTGGERRSIFSNFWQSAQQPLLPSSSLQRRVRSVSFSAGSGNTPPIMPRPSPLMDRAVSDQVWDPRNANFPELPSPLQRLRNHSGVYPLIRPQSILRNKSLLREQQRCSEQQELNTASFNLTQTLREALKVTDDEKGIVNQSSHSSSSDYVTGSGGAAQRRVHFDPRVTVTELAESEPRVWYADHELERFKAETVLLAKRYLMKHPEQIAVYSQPVKDPVTGALRKKALFSMSALSDLSDSELNGDASPPSASASSSSCESQHQHAPSSPPSSPTSSDFVVFESPRPPKRSQEMVPIRRILVVDRNEKICSLFQRSLAGLFGNSCEIVAVHTAHEALQRYPGADIVIAEERLYKPLLKQPASSMQQHAAASVPASERHNGMSGSQLFRQIAADPNQQKQRACLLIGVSTHPQQDGPAFRQAGADLVWGKPPPRMDASLRNELIRAVVHKRKAAS